jgi:hypothetical protein
MRETRGVTARMTISIDLLPVVVQVCLAASYFGVVAQSVEAPPATPPPTSCSLQPLCSFAGRHGGCFQHSYFLSFAHLASTAGTAGGPGRTQASTVCDRCVGNSSKALPSTHGGAVRGGRQAGGAAAGKMPADAVSGWRSVRRVGVAVAPDGCALLSSCSCTNSPPWVVAGNSLGSTSALCRYEHASCLSVAGSDVAS